MTSPDTTTYNCIAWAYGDPSRWFWPDINGLYFWPNSIPRIESLQSFVQLFASIGYVVCPNGSLEVGYEKIAIFVKQNGQPTHAARQLPTGFWTSKLGQGIDVTHSLFSMQDSVYGNPATFMKRAK
jgi:hypothetical protein